MSSIALEDTVILWDCSRSMIRTDFKPNRLRTIQKLVKLFIENKIRKDPKDSIAIAAIGTRIIKLADFSNNSDFLASQLNKLEISGTANVVDGIAFALQMLVKKIRHLGGANQRIIIFTDASKPDIEPARMQKIIKAAQGLGVYIDICQLGLLEMDRSLNPYRQIANATNSEYGFFSNAKALYRAAEGFASKKQSADTDYFDPNKASKLPRLVAEIAVDLRRPSISEIREMMGKVDHKCQICYQNTCPVCSNPFYSCGRFCPSCSRPIHMHCASMWSDRDNSEFQDKTVFRCPNCFFLLKVPHSVQQLMKITGGQSIKVLDEDGFAGKPIKMTKVLDNIVENIEDVCSFCSNIFMTGEETVYQCSCSAYYHQSCLEKMYNEIKSCRNCGGLINPGSA